MWFRENAVGWFVCFGFVFIYFVLFSYLVYFLVLSGTSGVRCWIENILITQNYLFVGLPSWKDSLYVLDLCFFFKHWSLVNKYFPHKNKELIAFSKKGLKTFTSNWNMKTLILWGIYKESLFIFILKKLLGFEISAS